MYGHVLIQSW